MNVKFSDTCPKLPNDPSSPAAPTARIERTETVEIPETAQTESDGAVGCSAWLGGFSEHTRKQSIKDLGASWLCLATTAHAATKSLYELELLISRPQSNSERVEQ